MGERGREREAEKRDGEMNSLNNQPKMNEEVAIQEPKLVTWANSKAWREKK